jgi:diguanylate cyclase (GGDEF)-like protein/PAS domain S-box-containing protein
MLLDIRTVIVVAAVLTLIIGVSLRFVLQNYPPQLLNSIRMWTLGTLLLSAAWMLYGLRGYVPDFVTIVVANGLLSLGFAKHVEAVRVFLGRPNNRALTYAPVLAVVLCELVFTYFVPSSRLRGVTVSVIIGTQLWWAVTSLMARGRARPRSHQLTAAAFFSLSVALFVRAAYESLIGNGLPEAFESSNMQSIAFGLGAAFPSAATLGFLLMCNDRLNRALVHNQERFRAITDNLPTIVAHIDTNMRFTFANSYLAQLLGLESKAIVGRTMLDVLGPAAWDEVRPHVDSVLGGKPSTFEMEREYHGQHRYFEASYVPDLDSSRRVRGFFVLIFDISRLKLAELELAKIAQSDSLTGLANRKKFGESLDLALARSKRHGHSICLLYIDIDHFKSINDSCGHVTGDGVLCEFSRRIERCLRETDLAVRLGGDEFAVLVEDVGSVVEIESVARKLLDAIRLEFVIDGKVLKIGASIGIGVSRPNVDAKSLQCIADEALYAAKMAGRGTYRIAGSISEDA